jgi:molecular chaperone GrpE
VDEQRAPEPGGEERQGQAAVLDDQAALEDRATRAEQQRDEYLGLLQRARADFDNYQKRNQRQMAEERRYAHAGFARDLLSVLDNLQRALAVARQQPEPTALVQGVAMVETQLLDVLRRFGVTPLDALGQPFDPNLHEAVQQQPRNDVAPGTVVAVSEPGYRLHERALRPARVVVAAPGKPQGQ